MPVDQPWILEYRRTLGDRIRDRRLWCSMTQEQMAHAAGISRDTVQRIERGYLDARVGQLLRITQVLDMPIAELFQQ
ncbi:helix-turn-helix transcriptional regulator [Streptomyces sp. NBC_00932]|uniref:helix-turn-helix transcriptional regulator n=1 Tax=Streptomyces sp. NBC_00932 TaxID=2903690 RepID=UPI00386F2A6A|nr:helix-turn-helix transcriptional regulator [Streptomyces sp. NBC_00932]